MLVRHTIKTQYFQCISECYNRTRRSNITVPKQACSTVKSEKGKRDVSFKTPTEGITLSSNRKLHSARIFKNFGHNL